MRSGERIPRRSGRSHVGLFSNRMTASLGISLVAAMVALGTEGARACGDAAAPSPIQAPKRLVPVSTMGISKPLLIFDSDGRFLRMDLRTGASTVISDVVLQREDGAFEGWKSRDGRWLVYEGIPASDPTLRQYWLYDLQGGTNRLLSSSVLKSPPLGSPFGSLSFGGFSPDGTYLAIFWKASESALDAKDEGVYLVETESLRARYLGTPLPLSTHLRDRASLYMAWTRSGDGLAVTIKEIPFQRSAKEYFFRYSLASGAFEPLEKQLPSQDLIDLDDLWMHTIHRNGERAIRSSGGEFAGVRSPDGRYVASYAANRLGWAPKGGKRREIAAVIRDHCTGASSIVLKDWLDSRHFVYQDWGPRGSMSSPSGAMFIVEVPSGRIARLDMPLGRTGLRAVTW